MFCQIRYKQLDAFVSKSLVIGSQEFWFVLDRKINS